MWWSSIHHAFGRGPRPARRARSPSPDAGSGRVSFGAILARSNCIGRYLAATNGKFGFREIHPMSCGYALLKATARLHEFGAGSVGTQRSPVQIRAARLESPGQAVRILRCQTRRIDRRFFGFWRGAALAEGHPEIGEGASGLRCEPTIEKHLRPRPP
jgi:hypothetical protein